MLKIDFRRVLKENLTEGCFNSATKSEKDFTDWVKSTKIQAAKCNQLHEEVIRYRSLTKQGRLIELPCHLGDKLYQVKNNNINECEFIGLKYDSTKSEWKLEVVTQIEHKWAKAICPMKNIGVTIFQTKEEAEQTLNRLRGNEL